jgi:hypothetical protein
MTIARGSLPARRSRCRPLYLALLQLSLVCCTDFTTGDMARINQWLGCIECSNGELQAVLALARQKPKPTTDTLGTALLRGPSTQERDSLRVQFAAIYQQVAAHSVLQPLAVTQVEYVSHYLDNIVAIYRIRAAQALAQIPGSDAKQYLLHSQGDSVSTPGDILRPDVVRAIFIADSAFNP